MSQSVGLNTCNIAVLFPGCSNTQVKMSASKKFSQKQLDFASFSQSVKCIIADVDDRDVEPFKEKPVPIHMLVAGVTHDYLQNSSRCSRAGTCNGQANSMRPHTTAGHTIAYNGDIPAFNLQASCSSAESLETAATGS